MCSFVESQCYVYKSRTIYFYYINNKYDKSKLETEEHVDDYFTCIYNYIRAHLAVRTSISLANGIRSL